MIGSDFITGGHAIFTVSGKNRHYTYHVSRPNPTATYPDPALFIRILTGPDNTRDYSYLGVLDRGLDVRLTRKSRYNDQSEPLVVLRRARESVTTGRALPAGWKVQHEGRCGRCGRKLTDPESIETGIGPVCAEKK